MIRVRVRMRARAHVGAQTPIPPRPRLLHAPLPTQQGAAQSVRGRIDNGQGAAAHWTPGSPRPPARCRWAPAAGRASCQNRRQRAPPWRCPRQCRRVWQTCPAPRRGRPGSRSTAGRGAGGAAGVAVWLEACGCQSRRVDVPWQCWQAASDTDCEARLLPGCPAGCSTRRIAQKLQGSHPTPLLPPLLLPAPAACLVLEDLQQGPAAPPLARRGAAAKRARTLAGGGWAGEGGGSRARVGGRRMQQCVTRVICSSQRRGSLGSNVVGSPTCQLLLAHQSTSAPRAPPEPRHDL